MRTKDNQVMVSQKRAKGRKKFVFPLKFAESFGKMGFTHKDIAHFLNVAEETVYREFRRFKSDLCAPTLF